jgi:CBS domain-containing protein
MPVEGISSRSVETCRPEDTLEQVAQKMSEHGVSGLLVIEDDGRSLSIITDLDIAVAASIEGRKLTDLTVREAMFRDVEYSPSSPPRVEH